MPCTNNHNHHLSEDRLAQLSDHQMHNHGRHKCCQCAYNSGFEQGYALNASPVLNINALGDSQASADGRHKSVHQAFALGYSDGVAGYISDNH